MITESDISGSRNSFGQCEGLIKALWAFFNKRTGTVDEEISAKQELEADNYAVSHQYTEEPAISVLTKLTKREIKRPTHFTVDGRFVFPVITVNKELRQLGTHIFRAMASVIFWVSLLRAHVMCILGKFRYRALPKVFDVATLFWNPSIVAPNLPCPRLLTLISDLLLLREPLYCIL